MWYLYYIGLFGARVYKEFETYELADQWRKQVGKPELEIKQR